MVVTVGLSLWPSAVYDLQSGSILFARSGNNESDGFSA